MHPKGPCNSSTVFGYSGIGKSSLVNELNKPITRNRGRFHVGKFDQYKRSVPYSALVQALDAVGKSILSQDERDGINAVRSRILDEVDEFGGVLTELVPSFQSLTRRATVCLPETGGDEAQRRQKQGVGTSR